MVPPIGTALRPTLRRTTTLMILGALTVLLALPPVAFASPAPVHLSAAPPAIAAPASAATGNHVLADPAAQASLRATLAPLLNAPRRSIVPAGLTPLYESLRADDGTATVRDHVGAAALHGAISSLSTGAGPAFGASVTCTSSSADAASCASAHPTVAHPDSNPYAWQNATPGAETIEYPGYVDAGTVAWDPYDQAVIYFGGCDSFACPDNQTWAYVDGYWQNITDFLGYYSAPPAVEDASMDYDYGAGEVVLFGGCGATICPMNETWLFSGGYWFNASAPYCFYAYCYFAPTPRYGASMTFANDTDDNSTVLFGGCLDAYCYVESNQTYFWVASADAWILDSPTDNPGARTYAGMVYDAEWGGTILFGGCVYYCELNDTWSFYDGQWTNLTFSNSYYGFSTPAGRGAAEMTYDARVGDILLFGGIGATSTNDLWAYSCAYSIYACGWVNVTPSMNLPGSIDLGATPSESSTFEPMVTGGECSCSLGALYETYVFEPLFTGAPIVTPNPARINETVSFWANLSGGSAPYSGAWYPGTGYYYDYTFNGTYNYSAAGNYTVYLYAYDAYGVSFLWNTSEYVGNVSAQISVGHATTEVGAPDNFSTPAANGGTAPYTYNWTFGDGTYGADAASVIHAYAAVGNYTANLTASDAYGITNMSSVVVTVGPAPTVTVVSSAAKVDLGTALAFTPTAAGGTAPYNYTWTFGDGTTATGAAPSHTYTTAGTYTVTVKVTDSLGGSGTGTVSVTVNPAVSGTVTATPTSITAGGSVNYSATGSGGSGTYTYVWVFGDGSRSTTASGAHSYATAGTYTATVWINDSLGSSYSHPVSITVTAKPGGGSSSSSSGLPGWGLWAAIGVVIIIVAAALVVMMGRRRKPAAGSPEAAPPTGASSGSAAPPPPPGAQ
jgi:PKD repeat protein